MLPLEWSRSFHHLDGCPLQPLGPLSSPVGSRVSVLHRKDPKVQNIRIPIADDSLRHELARISKILLVRVRSLGDSILTLPLLEALQSWRPDLQPDVLIEAPFAAVFSHNPRVHETLIMKSRSEPSYPGWTKTRALMEIRKRRYAAVLNLHGGTTSRLLTYAGGSRFRIGQESHRTSWAYNVRIPASSAVWGRDNLHTAEHQLTLLRWLGIPIPSPVRGRLYVDEGARQRVQERLHSAGISPHPFLLVQPTATLYTKQWKEENFARLADTLSERHSVPVIFTAGSREAQVLLEVSKNARRRHFYWPDLNLDELFALIETCLLFIGNDSGPTHAAAALGKPIVVIWGSSNFDAWHPWETEYEVIRSDLPCIPCPGYTCSAFGEPKCILEIPVERVLAACDRMLARITTGR